MRASAAARTYAHERGWERYQPHLPDRWRLRADRLPREERWRWSGLDVHLDRYEHPDARLTLIGLHGGGGYGRMLSPVGVIARRLGAEAVLPDLPGYGLTAVPRRRFTYDTWVGCVRDLAMAEAERGGRPVVALGMSMGGMLAWHAAAAGAPLAGVAATTLIDARDPAVRRAVGRAPWLGPVSAAALRALAPVLDPLPVPMALAANMRAIANDPRLADLCASDPLGGGRTVPARFLRTWFHYAPQREADEVAVPVLLAHPGEDRWTPTDLSVRFLERLAGPTELVVLEGCGHFPVEEPGASALESALAAFAERVATRAARDARPRRGPSRPARA